MIKGDLYEMRLRHGWIPVILVIILTGLLSLLLWVFQPIFRVLTGRKLEIDLRIY
jgi:hypothetical protein